MPIGLQPRLGFTRTDCLITKTGPIHETGHRIWDRRYISVLWHDCSVILKMQIVTSWIHVFNLYILKKYILLRYILYISDTCIQDTYLGYMYSRYITWVHVFKIYSLNTCIQDMSSETKNLICQKSIEFIRPKSVVEEWIAEVYYI